MFGTDGSYDWADHLGSNWATLLELALGKRVVVTLFDSGPMRVSPEEEARGWRNVADVVVTSVITSRDEADAALPEDENGEAWIYAQTDRIPDFSAWQPLAGQSICITLADPDDAFPLLGEASEDDRARKRHQHLDSIQGLLRSGLARYAPLTLVCGDLVATRDPTGVRALADLRSAASRCRCREHGDHAWALPDIATFTSPFALVATEGRLALFRCATCNARWVVERAPDGSVAVRASDLTHWGALDIWPARRSLLVAREGGEDDRQCRWAACTHRALRGREVCVDHMYRSR